MTTKKLVFLCIAVACAFLLSAAVASVPAYADIETFKLQAYQVGISYPYYSGKETDTEKGGVKLRVECNIDTDKLICEFDYFTDIDIEEYNDLIMHEPADNDSRRYKYKELTVYKNCDITFTAVFFGGEGENDTEESVDYKVNKVDNKAPRYDSAKFTVPTREGYNLKWRAAVTDNNLASFSAGSGIAEIVVFRFNPNEEFDATKPLESLGKIYDIKQTREYNATEYVGDTTVEFTMDQDGWYLIYMQDQIGNIGYASIANYTEEPDYLVSVDTPVGEVDVNIDVDLYEGWLTRDKGKIRQALWDDLRSALDEFIVTFQLEKPMSDKKSAHSVLQRAVEAYNKAEIKYSEIFTNKDLLDGEINTINLYAVATLLPGDTLEVAGIITAYNQSDIERFAHKEVIKLANITAPDKIISLSYRLLKNTSALTPKEPLLIQIEFPEGAEVALVSSVDNNRTFKQIQFVRDKDIIQFSSTAPYEDFYFVVRYGDAPRYGLIIGLSVGGGVFIIIIIVLAVLYKKGLLTKKRITPAIEDGDNEDDAKTVIQKRETLEKKRK